MAAVASGVRRIPILVSACSTAAVAIDTLCVAPRAAVVTVAITFGFVFREAVVGLYANSVHPSSGLVAGERVKSHTVPGHDNEGEGMIRQMRGSPSGIEGRGALFAPIRSHRFEGHARA